MRIIEDETIQTECISYVTKPGLIYFRYMSKFDWIYCFNRDIYYLGATAPPFSKIFSLYCSLKRDVTLKMWIEENKVESLNIDTR